MDEVPFITSPDNVTLEMLRIASVGPADHVIDLGSGDGRIVIEAALGLGEVVVGGAVEPDRGRLAARWSVQRPHRGAVRAQHGRGGRVPVWHTAECGQPGCTVVVEQVGQAERQVARVASELPGREGEHLFLGAHHAGIRAQIAQRRHPPLADHPVGVLADHAQHPDHLAVVGA